MEDVLVTVQQRLGLEENLSHDSQIRLLEEIQQETQQRYLRHVSRSNMPHIGHGFNPQEVRTGIRAFGAQDDASNIGTANLSQDHSVPDSQVNSSGPSNSDQTSRILHTASNHASLSDSGSPASYQDCRADLQTREDQEAQLVGKAMFGFEPTSETPLPNVQLGSSDQYAEFYEGNFGFGIELGAAADTALDPSWEELISKFAEDPREDCADIGGQPSLVG